MILHDLETTPLQIKTDSTAGSNDRMYLAMYSAEYLGTVRLQFRSPLKLKIKFCDKNISINITDHSILRPRNNNKVWQLTELSGHGIEVQCNGLKVLEILQPGKMCTSVKRIWFPSTDTASDAYRPARPGK